MVKEEMEHEWGDEDLVSRVVRTSESMAEWILWPVERFP